MEKRKFGAKREGTPILFRRYIWLVDTIHRLSSATYEEINELWKRAQINENGDDIPIRTFHNHRKAIEEIFDINIECNKRGGYIYYIEDSDDLARGGVRQWLLNTFAVNNLINESHKLKHRILFEHIPSGQKFLTSIIEAMQSGSSIEITYQSFKATEPLTIEIEPYCVKVYRMRWYLLAKSDDKLRIYALDRISDLRQSDSKFVMPTDFDSEAYFYNSIGVMRGEKVEQVLLKVYNEENKDRYIESLPLHPSQKVVERAEEYTIFSYELCHTYELYQEIITHGCDIEVLAPQKLRDELILTAEMMIENYKN